MRDEYIEVLERSEPVVTAKPGVRPPQENPIDEIEFAKRMDNWRRVLLGSSGGAEAAYCAGWARLYVAQRMAREEELKIAVGMIVPQAGATRQAVDELDGWLVEAAMRCLPEFNERKILQFHYVWQYPEHRIKMKLMLRRSGVKLVLGRARSNLKKILQNLDSAATILSNNLHAGVDPRPESIDAP